MLIIDALTEYGVKTLGLKFSGNRGFHLVIPSESFPEKVNSERIANLYPRLPREIVNLIRDEIREDLTDYLVSQGFKEEIKTEDGTNPFLFSDLENNWGDRHLFRLPYSLHGSSGLVSMPLKWGELESFQRKDARVENVKTDRDFVKSPEGKEAFNLVVQAMDRLSEKKEDGSNAASRNSGSIEMQDVDAGPEDFPPTIENILNGLEDGRKRGLFILLNFFDTLGFDWEWIEDRIWEWNSDNKEPLPESYINSQLKWHRNREETVPPPNYDADGYYRDMQVYEGDNLEEQVPNPVSYVIRLSQTEDDDQSQECPYCGEEFTDEEKYREHVQTCFND